MSGLHRDKPDGDSQAASSSVSTSESRSSSWPRAPASTGSARSPVPRERGHEPAGLSIRRVEEGRRGARLRYHHQYGPVRLFGDGTTGAGLHLRGRHCSAGPLRPSGRWVTRSSIWVRQAARAFQPSPARRGERGPEGDRREIAQPSRRHPAHVGPGRQGPEPSSAGGRRSRSRKESVRSSPGTARTEPGRRTSGRTDDASRDEELGRAAPGPPGRTSSNGGWTVPRVAGCSGWRKPCTASRSTGIWVSS